jgi:predicted alpha-1,2-mannosidase
MNTIYKLSLTLLSISTIFAAEKEPVDYVDLFLGTSSSRWMLYPGPSMPFGMVKLSPDNTDEWQMNAGYEYEITSISGFGHVHSWMMGSFLTMPTTGIVKTLPGLMSNPDAGYRSRFRHEREEASPGYYAVYLDDYQLRAELTATTRSGFQRYTYPESRESHILFDLQIPEEGRPSILAAAVKKISPTEIAGYVKREAGWNEYTLHFVARLNRSFDSMSGWRGEEYRTDIDAISITDDRDIGVSLNFATREGEVVLLKTGISYVSIEQARLNLEQESSAFGWDFDLACEQARSTWNSLLGKIRVEGGRESDKIKFYTNLYRSYNARTIFSDVNGKYMDMCEIVRVLDDPDSPVYGCDAFWNTFWNLNQLWTLLTPDIANKWVRSLLEIYDRGGWLSKGPAGIEYSSIMVASHEIPLIVSAYQKGIRNYDVQKAYEAMKKIQTTIGGPHRCGGYVGNRNLKSYMEMGYVPADEGSVSNTLEYAYDDWCVAQLAKALGKKDDYAYFMQRSQYYKNIFDETSGYMRPKYKGGPWVEDFQPVIGAVGKEDAFGTKHYVEGNAWQFSWFVPQNVPGLIDLIGVEEFNRRLNDGFEAARPNFVSEYVNHSNQPNMQAAYLFNYSGKPWLTQKWVREILDNYYGLGPFDGYPGDEDQGQMGAWYVMSAMGLFEMDGGASVHPLYELGSPLFEKVTIELDKNYYPGGTFVIEAHHASAENQYIQSAMLNDRPLNNFWFSHDELVKGGSLVLEMAAEPNKNWAVNGMTAVKTDYPLIVSTPYVNVQEKMFKEKIQVPMLCNTPAALIYYTLDGGEPDRSSQRYTRPVELTKTTTIKMRAYRGETASLTATVIVRKSDSKVRESAQGLGQGISYRYFDGFFRDVHDLSDSKPGKEGIMPVFSIENREKEQYFGYEFAGFIHLEKAGPYTFFLTTNDGSRLYIDDMMVINNDGLHPAAEVSRQLNLAEGYHSFLIRYFQEGGTHHFQLEWQGPGFERQVIPASVLYHEKE